MHEATTPSPQQNERREEILHAIDHIFRSKGVRSMRMDDLASALHISKRTLYEMFENKENLLLECLKIQTKENRKFVSELPKENNVIDVLLLMLCRSVEYTNTLAPNYFNDIFRYSSLRKYIHAQRMKNMQVAVDFFQKGQEEGLLQKSVDFRIVYKMCIAMSDALLKDEEMRKMRQVSPFKMMLSSVLIYIRGAATEEGRIQIDHFLLKTKTQRSQYSSLLNPGNKDDNASRTSSSEASE